MTEESGLAPKLGWSCARAHDGSNRARLNFTPEVIRDLFVDREGTLWIATVKIVTFLMRGSKAFELAGAVGRGITTLAQAKTGECGLRTLVGGRSTTGPNGGHNSYAEDPAVVEDGCMSCS